MTPVKVWDEDSQSWESGWVLVSLDEEGGTAVVKEVDEHGEDEYYCEHLAEIRTVDWDDFIMIERTD
tara:strand:- start:24089 stop:24289 length:201 start_codon:yes stop_codon:yes gene_type:complete